MDRMKGWVKRTGCGRAGRRVCVISGCFRHADGLCRSSGCIVMVNGWGFLRAMAFIYWVREMQDSPFWVHRLHTADLTISPTSFSHTQTGTNSLASIFIHIDICMAPFTRKEISCCTRLVRRFPVYPASWWFQLLVPCNPISFHGSFVHKCWLYFLYQYFVSYDEIHWMYVVWGWDQQEWGIAFANSVLSSDADERWSVSRRGEWDLGRGACTMGELVVSWKLPYAAALSL